MKVLNHTPFPHMLFESRTPTDQPIGVAVVTGTFRIVANEALVPTMDQPGVNARAQHRGEPGFSSLARESELIPFKPRTDIHLDAIARAPGGLASSEWPVRIRVGKLDKDLLVRGPHVWQHFALGGWKKTKPIKCTEVPLHYELAFGGRHQRGNKQHVHRENKVGTGWICRHTPRDADLKAPQVLALDEPEHRPGKTYRPQGCGPMPPSWKQRLKYAGTYDKRWKDEQWPCLPKDFDYRFYNSAHPDLTYDGYLEGREEVVLVNLTSAGVTRFRLPDYALAAVAVGRQGAARVRPLHLDTLHMAIASPNPEDHRVHLTWRAVVPLTGAPRNLSINMLQHAQEKLAAMHQAAKTRTELPTEVPHG